jgi:membrane dipeptidase
MSALQYTDHRANPAAWARDLGISREAIDIYLASEVIDLHIDTFIWWRIFRYDFMRRHGHGLLGARFYSQVDLPRIREAHVTGGIWSITTNPLRREKDRPEVFANNVRDLRSIFEGARDDVAIARNVTEYERARREGKHAAFIGIQGGNALDRDEKSIDVIPDDLVIKTTVVHLSTSKLGVTSAPKPFGDDAREGLSTDGLDFVKRLDAKKIFVDLAHIDRKGFFDALSVHDKSVPAIVSHTGVTGVYEHWRNVDDEQIRAIADTGGVVGVMYQVSFLGDPFLGVTVDHVAAHLDHIVKVAGDDVPALGSDWDGAIQPPRDMPTCLELPRLVEALLRRGWKAERIQKMLGKNFLRALKGLRG